MTLRYPLAIACFAIAISIGSFSIFAEQHGTKLSRNRRAAPLAGLNPGDPASQNWNLAGTTTLSERQHGSIAYNEATSQLIVFGGDNTVNVINDTWAFDGTRWNRLQPVDSPSPRTDASMVYFPVTGTLVLFGGDTHTAPNGLRNGTWTFDGNTWTALNPTHRPPPRYGASLAYDPVNNELVLFGGEGENGTLGDTWTFDGTDWTDHTSATGPSVRYGSVMAYDSVSGAVILFGGLGFSTAGTSTYESDTWSWKDHHWTQLSPAVSPLGRWSASMAAGAAGGLTLFGGYSDTGVPRVQGSSYNDTWLWNGTTWMQSTATGPAARYGAAMSAYPADHGVVLVTGCCNNAGGFYTDTWTFDGSAWSQKSRTDAPSVRSGAAAITDTDHNDIVLFGGFGGDGFLGDTWINQNGNWSQVPNGTTSPPGRFASNIAYDSQHHQAVMFGGQSGPSSGCSLYPDDLNLNHFCDDTWTFDGQSWTRQAITVASPPFRSLASMAYDEDTRQTVLFGGHSGQDTISDTWTWDGTTWTQQSPSNSPPGEPGSAPGLESGMMAWDPVHHQLILFGGEGNGPNGPQYFNETWQWTGSNWQQLQAQNSPPPMKAATLVFSPVLGGLVLSTGQGSGPGTFGTYSDSWFWDGSNWTQLQPPTVPPPRYFASAGYDATTEAILLFGGGGDDGYLDDTWMLRSAPQLTGVVSRKVHGGVGTFDIDLTNGGIECRNGGADGEYTVIFTFASPLTNVSNAVVTSGAGSVANGIIDGNNGHNYVVNLTGVTNAQIVTVTLSNVTDSNGDFGSTVSASMKVLVGDTNADGFVNSADISQTKAQSGQGVTSSNFREDLNTDGFINSGDISVVKSKSGTALP